MVSLFQKGKIYGMWSCSLSFTVSSCTTKPLSSQFWLDNAEENVAYLILVQWWGECVDLFLVDFKMFDNEKHKEYTGTENTLIKENLKKLVNYRPIMIRLPIIKGINDEIENAVATADFFAALGRNIKSVEFLPYHDFGVEKAKHVGVNQQMFEAPDEKQLELLKEVYRSKKIDVVE